VFLLWGAGCSSTENCSSFREQALIQWKSVPPVGSKLSRKGKVSLLWGARFCSKEKASSCGEEAIAQRERGLPAGSKLERYGKPVFTIIAARLYRKIDAESLILNVDGDLC
jgi:hypothetical protein